MIALLNCRVNNRASVADTLAPSAIGTTAGTVAAGDDPRFDKIGAQGPIGPMGPAGPQGLKGNTGAQGLVGPAGPQGLKGNTGAQGPVGTQGLQGIKGNTGAQGLVGPQGPVGPVGPAGVPAGCCILSKTTSPIAGFTYVGKVGKFYVFQKN